MPILINDKGSNNTVDISEKVLSQCSGQINISGNNNRIYIDEGCNFSSLFFRVGSDCTVRIGKNCRIPKLDVYCSRAGNIFIGSRTSCTWECKIYAHEPSSISIGEDCLIASGVLITSSDMHSIIDVETNERINQAEDVFISNHVWLAADVNVMKGSNIGRDTVVGARSIVTGSLPNNCVAVGVPAKVVRTGTNWRPDLI